jgi:two-component system cell cycle sensor histidine kinase/response regulator CckA
MKEKLPDKEDVRLAALRLYDILDTAPEQAFDDLTRLAAQICQTPLATISFVDESRVWFKSRVRLEVAEIARDDGFCDYAMRQTDLFIVSDAFEDERFVAKPLVTASPPIRFYAGAPLITAEDQSLGTLCVLDYVPRELSAEQQDVLRTLARQVMTHLELRRSSARLLRVNGALKQEIAAREQTRDALRRREEHFRSLIENASDIITILAGDGTIHYESPSVERFLGYKPEELLGKNILDYVHPEDLPAVSAIFAGDAQPTASAFEFRFRHRDESWHMLEAVCKTIVDEGENGLVLNSRDISERRQLEAQLLQAQKMEAVGRLAGGVAHDFNNLLTAITGYSELMLRRLPAGDPLRRHAEEIRKSGNRAAALTSQLLAFSRKQVMQPKMLDLNSVISEMEKMLRRLIGEDIELATMLASGLWKVKADPGQLEQVIMNLVVNARDAMREVGRLTIETSNIELDEEDARWHAGITPGRYVMLVVNDTGSGMDQQTRERVFEPFFTTKEVGKGTGLGLSTVYGIVKQSGGYIFVYSEPGKGATFKIYLPAIEEQTVVRAQRDTTGHLQLPHGRETVLLVEDEAVVRNLAASVLREQGYTVLEASNGEEAIELAAQHDGEEIHLLLTDVVMPRMSGREVAERLERARPGMRVMYTSGYTEDAIVHHGVMDDGVAFLPKPFTPNVLARKVREVLDGQDGSR